MSFKDFWEVSSVAIYWSLSRESNQTRQHLVNSYISFDNNKTITLMFMYLKFRMLCPRILQVVPIVYFIFGNSTNFLLAPLECFILFIYFFFSFELYKDLLNGILEGHLQFSKFCRNMRIGLEWSFRFKFRLTRWSKVGIWKNNSNFVSETDT